MSDAQESRPLLRSLSEASVSRIWIVCSVTALVVAWCVVDFWNRETTTTLFKESEIDDMPWDPFTGRSLPVFEPFKYTLTLAFLQFVFTGLVFCALYAAKVATASESVSTSLLKLRPDLSDGRWSALIGTHILGSVLLQSLMMPTQMMSLGFFAATRAVEIPFSAGVRSRLLGARFGGHAPLTTLLMCCAAWILFYSYSQIAECLCIWSGYGVALTGAPLYVLYALLLVVPATNTVLQETVLTELAADPIMMLGIQNIFAAVFCTPVLVGAHFSGYENVRHAISMIANHREVYMTIIWLCTQTAFISAITVGLILMVDSFWTVAARSARVVFWWLRQLPMFYMTSSTLLSVSRPHASFWSFGMVCGLVLGLGAIVVDRKKPEEVVQDKPSWMGKYV